MIKNYDELIANMKIAANEDRERFFKVADSLRYQPKYEDKQAELEELKQQWRDMTKLPDYPNINFPLELPDWFPKVRFFSKWEKDIYINETLKELESSKEVTLEDTNNGFKFI